MKKTPYQKIPILFAALIICAGFSSSAGADVRIDASGSRGLSLSYRPDNLSADSVRTNDKIYLRFSADNHTTFAHSGEPSIPMRTVLLAVPSGERPVVAVSVHSETSLDNAIPLPWPRISHDGSGFAIETYAEDPLRYAMSGFQPSVFAELRSRFDFGGVSVWELSFVPVRFDIRSASASVLDSLDVTVSWSGDLSRTLPTGIIPETVLNRSLVPVPARKPAAALASASPFATGDWWKIAVTDSGFYQISGSELASSGFPTGTSLISDIRMYYGGGRTLALYPHEPTADAFREIAIRVKDANGDGFFGSEDTIVFYGEAISRFIAPADTNAVLFQNHPYSATNTYWVTLSSEGSPLRIGSVSGAPAANVPNRTTFREILHSEREYQLEYAESGIEWYWDIVKGTTSKSFSFGAPGAVAGDSVVVRVSFLNPVFNKGNYYVVLEHNLEIYLGDTGPFLHYIPTYDSSMVEMRFKGSFEERGNLLKIRRTSGASDELIQLDWYEIEYERKLEFSDRLLEYFISGSGEPRRYTVGNVAKSTIEVFDTTDPYRAVQLAGGTYDTSAKTLAFQIVPPAGRYTRITLQDPSSYRKVSSITKKTHSDLRNPRNGADYIIISHKLFLDEAKKLADWRARDSVVDPLKTMVVDVADVYDEFAWGVFDPTAIRDFLAYTRSSYTPGVRYCCLFGDTTYKYKNIAPSQTSKNYIPTFTWKDVATDDFYTWNDTTNSPTFAIGRFCANTVEEAKTLVEKTIEYERNPEPGQWSNRALLIADDERNDNGVGQEVDFSQYTESFDRLDYIPKWLDRVKIMEIEYPLKNYLKPDATEALLGAYNDGCAISLYIGHGNKDLLSHEHILVGPRDIERFNNAGRQSLFIVASCSVGSFDRIDYTSLSELLHLRKNGGCVAVISATRETYNDPNITMVKTFFPFLFGTQKNPEHRIGRALELTKKNATRTDISENYYNRYHIFGDPATRLMIPRYRFSVAPVDSLRRLAKLTLDGTITDAGKPIPYTGTLQITARGPRIHKKYVIAAGYNIPYTMPGRTYYRGEIPISGTGFATSVIVPKDIMPDSDDSEILYFASGEGKNASWMTENLPVGSIDPNAPGDTAGPEIRLSFDGKAFESGDYIRRQPTMTVTFSDPSGINIYGNRGHNVTVTVDRTEVNVITDNVKFTGGHTNATATFAFPVLTPGEHILEVSAYDTYNNVSKKEVTMNVVGSETGDVAIQDLLNYPNPMNGDGTTFTFSLTDDAGSADIKIYSLAGRLVDTVRFSAGYGFNQVAWKPRHALANGVYFYKLTVRSLNGRRATKIEKLAVMR